MKKVLILLILIIVPVLSACSVGGKEILLETEMPSNVLFTMEELTCEPEEFRVFLANYKNLYGRIYETDFWANTSDKENMAQSIKEAAFAHLTRMYALDLYAIGHDITLTEKEVSLCDEAAEKYYASLEPEEISYTGASENTINKMYQAYALAEKAYGSIMETVNTEVSDDEARIMDAAVIFTTDRAKCQEALVKISEGGDFESVAATYSMLSYIDTSFGRGEYDDKVENIVFSLDNGESSGLLESSGGYMIFYCIEKYNEELSEQKKQDIIEDRRSKALDEIYTYYQNNATSVLNEDIYDAIKMNDSPGIETDSFFAVLDEFVSF